MALYKSIIITIAVNIIIIIIIIIIFQRSMHLKTTTRTNYLAQVGADGGVCFQCQTLTDVIGNSL